MQAVSVSIRDAFVLSGRIFVVVLTAWTAAAQTNLEPRTSAINGDALIAQSILVVKGKQFPKLAVSSVATKTIGSVGYCCEPGETRVVEKVAELDLATPKNYPRKKFIPASGYAEAIYSPPLSCWVISSYRRSEPNARHPYEALTDAQPAGFNYLTDTEYKAVFNDLRKYIFDLDIADQYKVKLDAQISAFVENYGNYAHSISTSHGQVRHRARVQGQGTFSFAGSTWYRAHITTHEICCPPEIRNASALRQTLLSWVDEVAARLPSGTSGSTQNGCTGTWTAWLSRDTASGAGDYETVVEHTRTGQITGTVSAIQCRRRHDRLDWRSTCEVYHCDVAKGGYCQNSEQAPGRRCSDYEVRFCQ